MAKPTIVAGLIDAWPARTRWVHPERFGSRFGHHRLFAKRSERGYNLVDRVGANIENVTLPFGAVLPHEGTDGQLVIMDLRGMLSGEAALLEDLAHDY